MGARLGRRAGPEAGAEAGAAAGGGPAPYERRVRWLREIQSTLRERRPERARQLLCLLRQAREGAGGRDGQGTAGREGPGCLLQAAGRVGSEGETGCTAEGAWAGERAGEAGRLDTEEGAPVSGLWGLLCVEDAPAWS